MSPHMHLQSKLSRAPIVTQSASKWSISYMSIYMVLHVSNIVGRVRTTVTDKSVTKRVESGH